MTKSTLKQKKTEKNSLPEQNLRFSARHLHRHALLMAKAKELSAIAAEVANEGPCGCRRQGRNHHHVYLNATQLPDLTLPGEKVLF